LRIESLASPAIAPIQFDRINGIRRHTGLVKEWLLKSPGFAAATTTEDVGSLA